MPIAFMVCSLTEGHWAPWVVAKLVIGFSIFTSSSVGVWKRLPSVKVLKGPQELLGDSYVVFVFGSDLLFVTWGFQHTTQKRTT